MKGNLNKLRKFEYTDILGWSASRYNKFTMCKRQYYYDYYGKYDREYPVEKIKLLKQMTSIPLEIGSVVHDTIKKYLERLLISEEPVDRNLFINYAKSMVEKNINAKTFAEVYYKKIEKIEIEMLFETIEKSLNNYLDSNRCKWIIEKAITNKKGWLIEPPGYGETRINDLKTYCKVDFLFPVDEEIYIVDWKTGKKDKIKHKKQLIGYSSWASYHFDINPEMIKSAIVYLYPSYEELGIDLNETDKQIFIDGIKKETEEMYDYCNNVIENIPKNKDGFSMTTNSNICNFCNYRELCKIL